MCRQTVSGGDMNVQIWCCFSLLILLGGGNNSCDKKTFSDCNDFYEMSPKQRKDAFGASSLERQYILYLCGMHMEPPQMGYAWEIAKHGENAIQFLIEKLEKEQNDITKRDIILIFEVIADNGHLRNKQDVISTIRQIVANIQIENIKKQCRDMLSSIEKNSL